MAMTGEIRVLSEEEKHLILTAAAEGRIIKDCVSHMGFDVRTFYQIRKRDPEFEKAFTEARIASLEHLADELRNVTDMQFVDVNLARLKSENARFILERLQPSKWGNRLDVNIKTIDITSLMANAEARLERFAPVIHPQLIQIAQASAITSEITTPETKCELVLSADDELAELLK